MKTGIKESKYIPISIRKNIEDKHIAKILDYLERHAKSLEWHPEGKNGFEEMKGSALVDGVLWNFNFGYVWINYEETFEIPTNILADNIVGIYGSLKNK